MNAPDAKSESTDQFDALPGHVRIARDVWINSQPDVIELQQVHRAALELLNSCRDTIKFDIERLAVEWKRRFEVTGVAAAAIEAVVHQYKAEFHRQWSLLHGEPAATPPRRRDCRDGLPDFVLAFRDELIDNCPDVVALDSKIADTQVPSDLDVERDALAEKYRRLFFEKWADALEGKHAGEVLLERGVPVFVSDFKFAWVDSMPDVDALSREHTAARLGAAGRDHEEECLRKFQQRRTEYEQAFYSAWVWALEEEATLRANV